MNTNDARFQADRTYVERAWTAYFNPTERTMKDSNPLPDAAVDLAPFTRDIIPGRRDKPWTARSRDLVLHFRGLEPEFRGLSRITHLTACTIVCLRRNRNEKIALNIFRRILSEAGPEIAKQLNSRWLTSICDTVIDTTDSDVDRALALTGTVFISVIKMAETELRLYRPQRPWPPKTRLRHGGEIYDGVQSLWTEGSGDVDNIFDRIDRGLKIKSPVTPIVEKIISRAIEGNTFINRIISTTGKKRLPIAPEDKLEELRNIMRSL